MDDRRTNGKGGVLEPKLYLAIGLLLSFGCSASPPAKQFTEFTGAENMHVQIRDNEGDMECILSPKFVDELQSAFSTATPEPNPLKWEVVGTVTYRRDGKDREAKLIWISQRECGFSAPTITD